jgi:hypothetical protein
LTVSCAFLSSLVAGSHAALADSWVSLGQLSPPQQTVSALDAASNGKGASIIGWFNETTLALEVRLRSGAAQAYGAVQTLAVQGASGPALAVDDDGTFAVTWVQRDLATNRRSVLLRVRPPRQAFGPAITVAGPSATFLRDPVVAFGKGGALTVAWIDFPHTVAVRRRPKGAGFGPVKTYGAASGTQFVEGLELAARADDSATMVWEEAFESEAPRRRTKGARRGTTGQWEARSKVLFPQGLADRFAASKKLDCARSSPLCALLNVDQTPTGVRCRGRAWKATGDPGPILTFEEGLREDQAAFVSGELQASGQWFGVCGAGTSLGTWKVAPPHTQATPGSAHQGGPIVYPGLRQRSHANRAGGLCLVTGGFGNQSIVGRQSDQGGGLSAETHLDSAAAFPDMRVVVIKNRAGANEFHGECHWIRSSGAAAGQAFGSTLRFPN